MDSASAVDERMWVWPVALVVPYSMLPFAPHDRVIVSGERFVGLGVQQSKQLIEGDAGGGAASDARAVCACFCIRLRGARPRCIKRRYELCAASGDIVVIRIRAFGMLRTGGRHLA